LFFFGFVDDGLPQRMFGAFFCRGSQSQDLFWANSPSLHHVCDRGLSLGDSSGLIQDNGIQLVGHFERLPAPDEDPVFCTLSRAHHDRSRSCQAQRTWTGNDHHRYEIALRIRECRRWTENIPDDEGQHGDPDDSRHEVAGDDVGESGNGGLGPLSLLHHLDNLGQHGVLSDLGGLEFKGARLVQGGSDNVLT